MSVLRLTFFTRARCKSIYRLVALVWSSPLCSRVGLYVCSLGAYAVYARLVTHSLIIQQDQYHIILARFTEQTHPVPAYQQMGTTRDWRFGKTPTLHSPYPSPSSGVGTKSTLRERDEGRSSKPEGLGRRVGFLDRGSNL